MKKKMVCMLGIGLLLSTAIVGCGTQENTKKTKDIVADETKGNSNTFTVGFDANFPPYGYKDESGEYVGFDLDLAQEVCDRNGWELVKQPIDWDSKDMELNSGTIDCIWNGFSMEESNLDKYTWSDPYVSNSQVVVVREDSKIQSLEDLAGKLVEVQVDSSGLKALEGQRADLTATFGSLTQVAEYNTAFMDLEAGAADAVVLDQEVAKYQMESRGDGFVMLDESISSEEYGIGFKKGNETLRDTVQKTLNEMAEDGTFMEIAKKWGTDETVCLGK
ncbi:MAG: amino acid ABC transporter substrate-binding protein [Candidatus Ruminococcus intestinipullorum]|nr:amino acid ABC transporter substrate-binding protein [Candidatus Ruminococcus intestinipullorum]